MKQVIAKLDRCQGVESTSMLRHRDLERSVPKSKVTVRPKSRLQSDRVPSIGEPTSRPRAAKSRGRTSKTAVSSAVSSGVNLNSTAPQHWRRCHVCGHVEEVAASPVTSCSCCGKVFAPFFFASEKDATLSVDGPTREVTCSDTANYRPLLGFTIYWEQEIAEGKPRAGVRRSATSARSKVSAR